MNTFTRLLLLLSCPLGVAQLVAVEYQGIEFPAGAISFADEVVSYEPGFSGGEQPTHEDFINPLDSLGEPDYPPGEDMKPGSVSIGSGGRIVLRFIDNALSGSDSEAPDLHIFEIGSDVEDTFVAISADGKIWHEVGKVSGSVSSIDIDAFGFTSGDRFYYVRLTDDKNEGWTTGHTVGADIDAVGAISTVPAASHADWLLLVFAILFIIIAIWVCISPIRKEKAAPCFAAALFACLAALLLLIIYFAYSGLPAGAVLYKLWAVVVVVFLTCSVWMGIVGKGVVATAKVFTFCWLPFLLAVVMLVLGLLLFGA